MTNFETVKGFRDIEDSSKRNAVRNIIENVFRLYGFNEIETPIVEYEDFVKGDNANDEAVSDIFKLTDRGDRKLALRYEFTFQLKRIAQNKKLPYKRCQIGPVFRDEPVSGNRWRQFTQCDIDIVGSTIKEEAEILKITSEILSKLGIKFVININNRKLLNEILENEGVKNKEGAIREIDKLDKLSEEEVAENLEKYGAASVLKVFKEDEEFFERYESYKEIKELKETCALYGVKVNFVPFLARGLSYYNGSVFEVKSDIKETITAGGSFMVNGVQSTGISFGLDRLELIANVPYEAKKVLVISLGQDKRAVEVADKLRKNGITAILSYAKITKALDYANSYKLQSVIFIGDSEVKVGKLKFKDMVSGKEKMLTDEELIKEIKK